MSDVLVLNFTYEALNVTSFQRAVKMLFAGKAELLHGRDRTIASTTYEMRMPSIIRMLYYIRRPMQKVALTKKNVLIRDDHTCQYCGMHGEKLMTVDHVIPKSRGGPFDLGKLSVCVHALQQPQEQPHAGRMQYQTDPSAAPAEIHPVDSNQAQHLAGRMGQIFVLV